MRRGWEEEVREFVEASRLLGYFTPQHKNWKYGMCVRCGGQGSAGFDAHISTCVGCKKEVERIEKTVAS